MKAVATRQKPAPVALTRATVEKELSRAVKDAFGAAISFMIFLIVILPIAAGVLGEMRPAPPPVLFEPETRPADQSFGMGWSLKNFAIVYAAILLPLAAARVAGLSQNVKQRTLAKWCEKAIRRISENWFELTVGNAIGAWVGALTLSVVQQFSWVNMAIRAVLESVQPLVYQIASWFFSAESISTTAGLIRWYDLNHLKFLFWILFISAVIDDLGVSNLKSLLRRARSRKKRTPVKTSGPSEGLPQP